MNGNLNDHGTSRATRTARAASKAAWALWTLPAYWLARAIPKRRTLWLFGAWFGRSYSDNSRYLYEYVLEHAPDIDCVWMTSNPDVVHELKGAGLPVARIDSLAGWWLAARAAVGVLSTSMDDITRIATPRYVLNLWHGMPMKRIMRDSDGFGSPSRARRAMYAVAPHLRWDLHVDATTSGQYDDAIMSSAFALPQSQLHRTGQPRHDLLVQRPELHQPMRIVYLPTHRREGRAPVRPLFRGLSEQGERLVALGAVIDVRLHPYHQHEVRSFPLGPGAQWLDDGIDLYSYLNEIDVLITDYSSVAADFLVTDRPIIYAAFDLDDYLTSEARGELYRDYADAAAGPICNSWAEVVGWLERLQVGDDPHAERRSQERAFIHTYGDNHARQRIMRLLDEQSRG